MKRLYLNSDEFDKNAILNYSMSDLILQENAAGAVARLVKKKLKKRSKILFLCGSGNNASDAIATSRMLCGDYECELLLASLNLNQNCKIQLEIAEKVGVKISDLSLLRIMSAENFLRITRDKIEAALEGYDCFIDGIFGAGLNRIVSPEIALLLEKVNSKNTLKIAIDIPSGLNSHGTPLNIAFRADYTVTMGVRKLALFSDLAKDFCGKIIVADLGLARSKFATSSSDFLLELSDLELPKRDILNVNKSDFGHAYLLAGEMSGAASLSAKAALKMGSGKVSIVSNHPINDDEIMQKSDFKDALAVAFGMGLGKLDVEYQEFLNLPCVVDADAFYRDFSVEFALKKDAILTPHPKEFASLLRICKFQNITPNFVQENRLQLAREFSQKFPATLLLKGSNPIIAKDGILYISNLGSPILSVAGSGDVLSGIILGYLAQNFSPLKAAINGVLAHQKTALNFKKNGYSFSPKDMIKGLRCL